LNGGAGYAGQPSWSSDSKSLVFITEGEAAEGGSFWNLMQLVVATGKQKALAKLYGPGQDVPESEGNTVECMRPVWMGNSSVVYADWGLDRFGRLYSVDVDTLKRTNLYSNSKSAVDGGLVNVTGFCRPAVRAEDQTIAVSVWRKHLAQKLPPTWTAEVLDPKQYGTNGVQPDVSWPLNGGFGVGQLQWRPGTARQIALVEFDAKIVDPLPLVLEVWECPKPGPPVKHLIANLDAYPAAGEPRWSKDGSALAFTLASPAPAPPGTVPYSLYAIHLVLIDYTITPRYSTIQIKLHRGGCNQREWHAVWRLDPSGADRHWH
jgi:hypothetical protein